MSKATKNDIAWQELFDRYNILQTINSTGFYEIEAKTINTVRESRLMAKFDHYVNLPKIFKDNKLSILPISRSKYIIGRFETYEEVSYDSSNENISVSFPQNIETIDHNNLYSESSVLHCAYLTGIIDDILEEQCFNTVSGRMTTERFNFHIRNKSLDTMFNVPVENAQIEIDAGYESDSSFLIVEAKNFSVEDFLIRQLYYPYRVWQKRVSKKVVPAFMTYSNDVFSFFIYDFEYPEQYNSIKLLKQKNYIIAPEQIVLDDILDILNKVKIVREPKVPFPQADKFGRVVDLLGLLMTNDLTKELITQNYQFTSRQTDYYTNAGIYLGLIYKYKSKDTCEITYTLTTLGKEILKKKYKSKYLALASLILEHEIFNKVLRTYLQLGYQPDLDEVVNIMNECYMYNIDMNSSTPGRRARSVLGWVSWTLELTENRSETITLF